MEKLLPTEVILQEMLNCFNHSITLQGWTVEPFERTETLEEERNVPHMKTIYPYQGHGRRRRGRWYSCSIFVGTSDNKGYVPTNHVKEIDCKRAIVEVEAYQVILKTWNFILIRYFKIVYCIIYWDSFNISKVLQRFYFLAGLHIFIQADLYFTYLYIFIWIVAQLLS